MSPKKLASLLTMIVLCGQATVLSTLFAQAESQEFHATPEDAIHVASVIEHSGLDGDVGAVLNDGQPIETPGTPDTYTVNMGEEKPAVVIQAQPHEDGSASLLVNALEVFRFRGAVTHISSYERAKTVADRLNRMLVINAEKMNTAKPALVAKMPVVQVDGEVLTTIDSQTAKAAKLPAERMAFVWTNRLREALGESLLTEKEFARFAHISNYRGTGRTQMGMASWYGPGFHGRRTASGSRFNMFALTAAHRSLPFGTLLRVTNQRTKKSCVVRVTDRGPYAHGRIIDLSKGAAQAIGMSGVARVTLEVVNRG